MNEWFQSSQKKKWMVPEAHTGPTLYWAGWRDSSKFKFIALSVPFQLVFRVQSSCMRRCLQGERTQSNIQYHFRNYSSSILLIVLFFISLPKSNTRANTRKNVLVCMFFTCLNRKSSEVLQISGPKHMSPEFNCPIHSQVNIFWDGRTIMNCIRLTETCRVHRKTHTISPPD